MRKKKITDERVYRMLATAILVLWSFLAVWMSVDPPSKLKIVGSIRSEGSLDVQDVYYICRSSSEDTFSAAVLACEGLLLLYGLYLCWTTRHISDAMSEKREIALGIYNSFFTGLLALGVIYGFDTGDPDISEFLLPCVAILFGSQIAINGNYANKNFNRSQRCGC